MIVALAHPVQTHLKVKAIAGPSIQWPTEAT